LKPGDLILDKYEVRGLLGKGGHAFVYDCFNTFLAEEVAIKLIPNLEHHGSRLLKRARGEAQVLYRLNHPNVVRVMDGGELNGMAYIVMEKLNGISLRQMLRKRGSLPVTEALLIALQVAQALEAAHAMNVIHRDLKPDNVFLLADNQVKVLDFGIAKFLEGERTTQRDLIQGTAPYMSPEHAQGIGVTFASDIFQLGTILYEMIAGVCPCMIGVEDATLQELVAIQITKLPPRLKVMARCVPDYVDRLVWRAIAKQAQQRFANMPAFTAAISGALERLDVELPRERMQRAATTSRSSSRPPPPIEEIADSGVVKTTPLARSASNPTRHSSTPPVTKTAPLPKKDDARVVRSARVKLLPLAASRSASATLIRAALIGAVAAVPVGVGLGLARRASRAKPAAVAPIQSQPIVATEIAAPTSSMAPTENVVTRPLAPSAASSLPIPTASSRVAASASAKSLPHAVSARTTSTLDSAALSAPTTIATSTAPVPSAVRPTHSAPKSIF
jgi:serine/threonine-protein kinase